MNRTSSIRVFPAVWCAALRTISGLTTLLLGLVLPVSLLAMTGQPGRWYVPWLAVAGPGSVLVALAFSIRRYEIEGDVLRIVRPGWSTVIHLAEVDTVEFTPQAFRRAWRVWGNGGFFSFSGWFYQRPRGLFRAWVTDPSRSVTLRLGRRRIVVSPEPPLEFVEAIVEHLRKRRGG